MADISKYSTACLRGCNTLYFAVRDGEYAGGFWVKLKGSHRGSVCNANELVLKRLDEFEGEIVLELNTDIRFQELAGQKRVLLTLSNLSGETVSLNISLCRLFEYVTHVELQGYIPF